MFLLSNKLCNNDFQIYKKVLRHEINELATKAMIWFDSVCFTVKNVNHHPHIVGFKQKLWSRSESRWSNYLFRLLLDKNVLFILSLSISFIVYSNCLLYNTSLVWLCSSILLGYIHSCLNVFKSLLNVNRMF